MLKISRYLKKTVIDLKWIHTFYSKFLQIVDYLFVIKKPSSTKT